MLPVNYLMPCIRAISELICNYHWHSSYLY